MKNNYRLLQACAIVLGIVFLLGTGQWSSAQSANPYKNQVADVSIGWNGISFRPNVSLSNIILTVSKPSGTIFSQTFEAGRSPYYELSESDGDGSYTYELKVIPEREKKVREKTTEVEEEQRSSSQRAITQTGYFAVQGGRILTGTALEPEDPIVTIQDIVHSDDVIIDGSLSVGTDSVSGYDFGFDTIVLRENNLRILFDDTSAIQNYPRNDWRLIANDSTDGGGSYFAIEDATEVANIFVLEAGAPDNSLYVDSHGDVGINTSTPYYELHIVDGDSPCVRLDQDGSYGWTPQKWDLCGNESNFFIRDATHASKLPFRIEPDSPTDSIFVADDGKIGFGTGSPAYRMEAETTGENCAFVLDRTDGATNYINATGSFGNFGTVNNYPLRLAVNSVWRLRLDSNGSLTMSNGATCSTGGSWINASSREVKENIVELSADEAQNAINDLNPVKFNYKADKEEENIGFIAEDVPELLATKDRKGLSPMDVVAVLTKVVQEQQKTIADLEKRLSDLENISKSGK